MEQLKVFLQKNKSEIIFSLLILYVLILGFGVIGEIFNIKWILNLPLFRI